MAEIGLVASIVGIATAATQLSLSLYKFADNMRHCRPEATVLANEVSLLGWSLDELADSFRKASKISKRASRTARELIGSCRVLIEEVQESLERSCIGKKGGAAFWASVKWPFKRDRLDSLRSHLESLKTTMLVLLGSMKLKSANDVRRLKRERQDLKEEVDSLRTRLECLMRTHEAAAATFVQSADRSSFPSDIGNNDALGDLQSQSGQDDSLAETLDHLALARYQAGGFDGRWVLSRDESELQVGRLHIDLLPQMMAYRLAESVLDAMDLDEDEDNGEATGPQSAEQIDHRETTPHAAVPDNYRTVLREPSAKIRQKTASPDRPSLTTAAKMVGLDPKSYPTPPKVKKYTYSTGEGPSSAPVVVEPSRSSRRERIGERDRDYRYKNASPQFFGENGTGTADPRYNQPKSFRNADIDFSPRISPEDVRYSTSSRRDRPRDDFSKPQLDRSKTYVY